MRLPGSKEVQAMPRRCSICDLPQRQQIDEALLAGEAYRSIAQQFAASPDAVYRHKQGHLPRHLCQAKAAHDMSQADVLLGKIRTLEEDARRIQATAEQTGDLRTALQGVRELVRMVELQGKLLGELQDGAHVNVLVLPEWLHLRTAILIALAPYPEARAAVATVLVQGSPDVHTNGTGA